LQILSKIKQHICRRSNEVPLQHLPVENKSVCFLSNINLQKSILGHACDQNLASVFWYANIWRTEGLHLEGITVPQGVKLKLSSALYKLDLWQNNVVPGWHYEPTFVCVPKAGL
jgi:hypothetical protein